MSYLDMARDAGYSGEDAEFVARTLEEDHQREVLEAENTDVVCAVCGVQGHPYFNGHSDPYAAHPCYTSTGSEGRCDICGGPPDAETHKAHKRLELIRQIIPIGKEY